MCLLFQRKESVVVYMTIDEAIYCLKSYQPDHDRVDMCLDCKYYGSVQVDSRTFTCKSSEARAIAIKALKRQKTGKWIPVTNGRGGHECSECHSYAPSYQSGDEMLANYCPNCGAKMEVKDDDR